MTFKFKMHGMHVDVYYFIHQKLSKMCSGLSLYFNLLQWSPFIWILEATALLIILYMAYIYYVPVLAVAEVIDSDKVYYYTSNPNEDSSNFCPLVPFAIMFSFLKWKITCTSDWSLTSSMFELMVNSWWMDWYWCVFPLTDIPPHAAALQSSCQCCSSTPCATKPTIRVTPAMTASYCPRWDVVLLVMSFIALFTWRLNVFHSAHYCFQGHAAPILYAAWAEAGFIKESDLLNLRKVDSDLEGHPTPVSKTTLITTYTPFKSLGFFMLFERNLLFLPKCLNFDFSFWLTNIDSWIRKNWSFSLCSFQLLIEQNFVACLPSNKLW